MSNRVKIVAANGGEIEIDADRLAAFEELEDRGRGGQQPRAWTAEEDALLLKYWPIKLHRKVAKLIGVTEKTCLKRYRELTEA